MTDFTGRRLGRYLIEEKLGEGGMAVVYRASDERLGRSVAVKVIRVDLFPTASLDAMLKRFDREARALASLTHANIVGVIDYGESEGSPYLVMEYLPGGSLKDRMGTPMAFLPAARIATVVAGALDYAHAKGIIHRDVKPSNILLTSTGDPMLSDFGIAKLLELDGGSAALTSSGMAIGTPEYMAPEQWMGRTGPASDQYSLGIILYELVAGRKPYTSATPGELLLKQASQPIPFPHEFAQNLPDIAEQVIVRALAREPAERYPDMKAFAAALEEAARSGQTGTGTLWPRFTQTPNGPVDEGQSVITLPPPEKIPLPEADVQALRESYLHQVFSACGLLSLAGIDRKAASESQTNIDLSAVYTALMTQSYEDEHMPLGKISRQRPVERESHRVSALEMLNRHARLVLLGDPGSGKSTFVSFTALCMAGELLGRNEMGLALLRTPLPEETLRASMKNEEPQPQPWDHGALLPVKIVLRDLAARGLPAPGKRAGVEDLWRFLGKDLETAGLEGFTAHLRKILQEQGGLVMFDGLDEVPEAEQRRAQIKQIVEGFAAAFPRCRTLVTSRTYAYQKQEWRLAAFTETTMAPFSEAQICQFIDRWYAHIAVVRKLNAEDAHGQAELLKNAALGSERLRGLAERPLLLTLMASLHAWRGGTLPERREELYSDAVDLLLDWWEAQRVLRGPKGDIILAQPSLVEWLKISDRQQVRELLNRLAYEAHQRQPNLNGTADVPEGDLASGLLRLSERDNVDVREMRDYLNQRAGLLLPRGVGVYTFPHRTFQEYLAACCLTDHDYPDLVAELACKDYERWREVALLSGAKAARGTASAVWSLVDALCYTDSSAGPCSEPAKLWGAHLAGQVLLESANLAKISERNQPKLERVRRWLVHILQNGELPTHERLLAGDSLARLGDPRFDPGMFYLPCDERLGFLEVAAGPFRMGSDPMEDKQAYVDEQPLHAVDLPAFYIARYPVTVMQFKAFVDTSQYSPHDPNSQCGLPNHPVVLVTWHDALAYCRWLDAALRENANTPSALRVLLEEGYQVTLPSEAEWEKAARGTDQRIYPWIGEFDADKANTAEVSIGTTSATGCFPVGGSPYGAQDMSGNVWEWTRSLWGKDLRTPDFGYPYDLVNLQRENLQAGDDFLRILRGGSWNFNLRNARCANRSRYRPGSGSKNFGFRLSLSHGS